VGVFKKGDGMAGIDWNQDSVIQLLFAPLAFNVDGQEYL